MDRASRDMLLKLGYMEDIVDLLEPALEVKSIGSLSYALHYPEWSHKPSSELPSTCKVRGSSRRVALLLLPDAPIACDACSKVALLVVLCSLQVILGVLD